NSTNTFIEVINHIGPSKIAELELMISGYPMLSKQPMESYEGGYRNSLRQVEDGYLLITKLSTDMKMTKLQEISDRLGLGYQVMIVDK
ncbi:MAG: hypothetical protein Q4A54_10670, partial [Parabacteroides sp.]|nr:hypothetical protein [Parabacteroides sp.]